MSMEAEQFSTVNWLPWSGIQETLLETFQRQACAYELDTLNFLFDLLFPLVRGKIGVCKGQLTRSLR